MRSSSKTNTKDKKDKDTVKDNSKDNTKELNNNFNDQPYKDVITQVKLKDDTQKYLNTNYVQFVKFSFIRFKVDSFIPATFKNMKIDEINNMLLNNIKDGVNYDNQTLSYTIKDIQAERQWIRILKPLVLKYDIKNAIDCTGNLGGVSISMALHGLKVDCYEMLKSSYCMLVNNIELYNLENTITPHYGKYDYVVKKNDLVYIDPPFEYGNLSLDDRPIYVIVEELLTNGASCVVLNMPMRFKYNKKYAIEKQHDVSIYYVDKKDVKLYTIQRGKFNPELYSIKGTGINVDVYSDQYYKLYDSKLVRLV
jgi:hypothetical protein